MDDTIFENISSDECIDELALDLSCQKTRCEKKLSLMPERDAQVKFEEASHVYYINEKQVPMSVTGVVGRMFNPFEREKIAQKSSKARKDLKDLSPDDRIKYILSEYNFAANRGTLIHKKIELHLLHDNTEHVEFIEHKFEPGASDNVKNMFYKMYPPQMANKTIAQKFAAFKEFERDISRNWDLAAVEYIVWDDAFCGNILLAGCIDAIFWANREQREIIIVDWKTNANLRNNYKYNTCVYGSPFDGEKNDTLDKYSCQLHLYARILEKNYNVKVVSQMIVHFSEFEYTVFSVKNYKLCKCYI